MRYTYDTNWGSALFVTCTMAFKHFDTYDSQIANVFDCLNKLCVEIFIIRK